MASMNLHRGASIHGEAMAQWLHKFRGVAPVPKTLSDQESK